MTTRRELAAKFSVTQSKIDREWEELKERSLDLLHLVQTMDNPELIKRCVRLVHAEVCLRRGAQFLKKAEEEDENK